MNTRRIIQPNELDLVVGALKQLGYQIVLMQGCFDLPHVGHKRFFEEGKKLGEILIVGVDSDELTKKRKGENRPIIPQDERMEMVLGLFPVDYVVLKELRDDVDYLAKQIKPDVLVFSRSTKDFDDYERVMTEKHQSFCKKIVWLDPQATTSTSANIAKIIQTGKVEAFESFFQDLVGILRKHGFEFKQDSL